MLNFYEWELLFPFIASISTIVYIYFTFSSTISKPKKAEKSQFGVYMKLGLQAISTKEYEACMQFLESGVWRVEDPPTEICGSDPLLAKAPGYGEFMMAFDFHLAPSGPKLIEINTNADNISTALQMLNESGRGAESQRIRKKIVNAIYEEYNRACPGKTLHCVCVVDFDLENHRMLPEYNQVAVLLRTSGIECYVIEPHDITRTGDELFYDAHKIDLIYNRLSMDKRLLHPSCKEIREVAIKDGVVLTPHPAVYVHSADKRQLVKMHHPCVPKSLTLSDKPRAEWWKIRADYVFKPFSGYASQGVIIGAEMTQRDLRSIRDDHVVQEFVDTAICADQSKFDFRLYTYGTEVFVGITRHFVGEKMNMQHPLSGIRLIEIVPPFKRIYPNRLPVADPSDKFVSTDEIKRQNKKKEEERAKTKRNAQHQFDMRLRKVSQELYKTHKPNMKVLSKIRKQIMKELKKGTLLPGEAEKEFLKRCEPHLTNVAVFGEFSAAGGATGGAE